MLKSAYKLQQFLKRKNLSYCREGKILSHVQHLENVRKFLEDNNIRATIRCHAPLGIRSTINFLEWEHEGEVSVNVQIRLQAWDGEWSLTPLDVPARKVLEHGIYPSVLKAFYAEVNSKD